ncbi:hypothetical protein MTY59_39120 [Mycobacterium senriense]|uniref:Uncharacterized protein n=1 Tax=Mycobacterium senriense TaxID=2775496 RepID=A0ABM7SRX6_9MYCO|nr:hypothetical protein MTY59_39120 [Mycobacterium senriense]
MGTIWSARQDMRLRSIETAPQSTESAPMTCLQQYRDPLEDGSGISMRVKPGIVPDLPAGRVESEYDASDDDPENV